MCVGRLAPEKNLEAFLRLDLPGTKVVIGHGPQEAELRARFPRVRFLGSFTGESLAARIASADVFVFPSRTDTFGIVQLEALACGVPVAAFPVTGPMDVIAGAPVGVLSEDLQRACIDALMLSRRACRRHAEQYSWERSAAQFLEHMSALAVGSAPVRKPPRGHAAHAGLESLEAASRPA
jgi:glycosyltransferase involved in cell wall biosynthesis